MFKLEDFWKEFDEDPKKVMEDNLEIKLDNHPYVCMGTFYKTVLEGNGMSNFMLLIFPPQEDKEKFLKSTQEYLGTNRGSANASFLSKFGSRS